jgi:hypothetical protein
MPACLAIALRATAGGRSELEGGKGGFEMLRLNTPAVTQMKKPISIMSFHLRGLLAHGLNLLLSGTTAPIIFCMREITGEIRTS